MKAFWWFEKDSIAGMARPGFNSFRWFDLDFEEAALLGWLGQYSSGAVDLESFRHHLGTYVPKLYKFYKLDHESGARAIQVFKETAGMMRILERLAERTRSLESFHIAGGQLHFKTSEERLAREIDFLKQQGIARVISLTEHHHNRAVLQQHFSVHHIGIEDLNAPQVEQVHQLAEVIKSSVQNKEKLAVHCLAGIGRTSTMLMAAHIVLGETLEGLQERLARQNPSFVLSGPQADFLRSFAQRRSQVVD